MGEYLFAPNSRAHPMTLTAQDVSKIADLAKLHLDETQLAKITHSLSDLITFIDQMASADTKNVTPMAHPLSASQPLRADEVSEIDQHEQLQQLSADAHDHLYWVPAAIVQK